MGLIFTVLGLLLRLVGLGKVLEKSIERRQIKREGATEQVAVDQTKALDAVQAAGVARDTVRRGVDAGQLHKSDGFKRSS